MHLRTFYSWLFKVIKLQDLLTDNMPGFKGLMYPYSNDNAIMYPMIEIARHHFKFFSEVLYILNRENPISGIYAHQNLQQIGADEIRARKSYPAVLEPISGRLDRLNDAEADCVIMAKDNLQLGTLLRSIGQHVSHLATIYVIFSEEIKTDLNELQEQFPEIVFLNLSEFSSQEEKIEALDVLFKFLGDYVILGRDSFEFKRQLNCNACIKYLEETFAYAFYLDTYFTKDLFTEKNEASKIPCQYIREDVFAWKFRQSSHHRELFNHVSMGLYRKEDILSRIQKSNFVDDLISEWENNLISGEFVGLFFQEARAFDNGIYFFNN